MEGRPTYDKFCCWNPGSIYPQAAASSKDEVWEHMGSVPSLLNPQSG